MFVRPVNTILLVADPRAAVLVKLMKPPAPAVRVRPANVKTVPAVPGCVVSVELPGVSVRVPRLSLSAVTALPLTCMVPPLSVFGMATARRVLLTVTELSRSKVPPVLTVTLAE